MKSITSIPSYWLALVQNMTPSSLLLQHVKVDHLSFEDLKNGYHLFYNSYQREYASSYINWHPDSIATLHLTADIANLVLLCTSLLISMCKLLRAYLATLLKHKTAHFKQYNIGFHTFFHSHIYQKYSNNITQTNSPNTPLIF